MAAAAGVDCDPWEVVEASHGVALAEAVLDQRPVQRDPAEEACLQEAHAMVQNGEAIRSPRSVALAAVLH